MESPAVRVRVFAAAMQRVAAKDAASTLGYLDDAFHPIRQNDECRVFVQRDECADAKRESPILQVPTG